MRYLQRLLDEHGDTLEGDLAYRGFDLRDLYRPGSGLTPRRLWVLIKHLPRDAYLWTQLKQAEESAQRATEAQLRARARAYGQSA